MQKYKLNAFDTTNHFLIFLTFFFIIFVLAIFQKLGYHKIFQKNKKNKQQRSSLSHVYNKKWTTLLFTPSHFFSSSRQNKPKLSLSLSAINCNHKPSLKVCTTCCKSSQNTSFSSLCYLLQNQAIKTIVLKPSMGVNLGQKYYTSRDVWFGRGNLV